MALRRIATSARMSIELEEAGEFGTTDYSMTFKSDGAVVSPWHDMPLELEGGLYNMLTEIPKMTLKKMEVDTKAPGNPIKQDEKKGKPRLYHGPIFWNYGCLPQTWEDPNVKGDGELDWKVIAISKSDPNFAKINDVDDIEKVYPGTVSGIRDWFRWYNTPDGKPI